jgi:phage-related protein
VIRAKGPGLACRFYMSASGNEPVREWLRQMPATVRQEIGSDIEQVQWRWPVGLPLVDGLGQGLYEIRTKVDRNIYRVFFCVADSVMWLLHAIAKKSRKAPPAELDLARRRQREIEEIR